MFPPCLTESSVSAVFILCFWVVVTACVFPPVLHTHTHTDLWTSDLVMFSNCEAEWKQTVFCTGVKLIAKNIEVLNWVIQFDLVYESTVQWITFVLLWHWHNLWPTFRVWAHQLKKTLVEDIHSNCILSVYIF